LFGFSIGGIAGIAYDIFSKSQSNREPCIPSNFFSMTIALLTPFIMFLFLWLNGVNSILASSFGALLGTVVIVYQRKDLVLNAIWSGLLTVGVLFSVYFLLTLIVANEEILMQAIWLLNSTNLDVRLHGIPLTELFWAFSCGSFLSPFYETVSSLWRITPNNYRVNSVCSVQ
ncbi:MAG: lycopene cyclase domain-containing protein, partial [Candidatus Paceibacterota bacterium]